MDFQVPDAAVPAVTTLIVFTSLSVFTLILRLYTRAALVKNVGADDYLMICSVAGSVAFLAVVFLRKCDSRFSKDWILTWSCRNKVRFGPPGNFRRIA